ncbi:MAG: hypothetical protein ACLT2T_15375 [Bilophila wadsworthia]
MIDVADWQAGLAEHGNAAACWTKPKARRQYETASGIKTLEQRKNVPAMRPNSRSACNQKEHRRLEAEYENEPNRPMLSPAGF